MRWVAVLAMVLVACAAAQSTPPTTFQVQSVGRALRFVEPTPLTAAEVARLAGGNALTRNLRWGRVIPWVGGAIAVGGLLVDALNWFYREADRAIQPDLDEYYDLHGPPPTLRWAGDELRPVNEAAATRWMKARGTVCQRNNIYITVNGNDVQGWSGRGYLSWNSVNETTAFVTGATRSGVISGVRDLLGGTSSPPAYNGLYDTWTRTKCGQGRHDPFVPATGWDTWFGTRPEASAAAAAVVSDFLEHEQQSGSWPYTYSQPYGPGFGVSLDPPPNQNQWYDNPYANPALDTDGDGFEDWKEVVAGTDPVDPNSYPTVDPGVPQPGEDPYPDPYPDRDGDGVPDQFDPCPFDALNRCTDQQVPEAEPLEIPDDYMRDLTGQAQLGVLQDILSELREDEQDDQPAGQPDAPMPELTPLSEPSLTWTVLEDVAAQIESAATSWWADAQTRLPFALGVAWLPAAPSIGAGECQGVQMTILGQEQEVGLCGTAIDTFLAGPGRAVLLAALLVGFYLATAQVVTRL